MHSTSIPLKKDFLLNLNDEEFNILWNFIEQEQSQNEIYEREIKVRNMILDSQSKLIEKTKQNFEI